MILLMVKISWEGVAEAEPSGKQGTLGNSGKKLRVEFLPLPP